MIKNKVEVRIDWDKRVAYVSRSCVEKYARKLLQDKLKAETPFKGGWNVWIINKNPPVWLAREKWKAFKPHTSEMRGWTEDDDSFYIFEITNSFATLGGLFS